MPKFILTRHAQMQAVNGNKSGQIEYDHLKALVHFETSRLSVLRTSFQIIIEKPLQVTTIRVCVVIWLFL